MNTRDGKHFGKGCSEELVLLGAVKIIAVPDAQKELLQGIREAEHWYCFGRHRTTFRGAVHTVAFWSSPVWSLALLFQATSMEMCIHAGLSLAAKAFLFAASSKYHTHPWRSIKEERLGARLDFLAIHFMIAFSLSPMYSLGLGTLRSGLILVLAGIISLAGAQYSFGTSKVLRTALYIVQGALAAAPLVVATLNSFELLCMLVAGMGYLVGSACYAFEFPTPSRRHWGHVECWHLLVLVSASGTYAANYSVLRRHISYL